MFSHVSKVDLVRRAASAEYQVRLHVILLLIETSVCRVAQRGARGGDDVPEGKTCSRHDRLWGLVAAAIARVEAAIVNENSRAAQPFRRIAHTSSTASSSAPPAGPDGRLRR